MKRIFPVIVLALAALLSGCMEQGGDEGAGAEGADMSQIKAEMVDAAQNVNSYTFNMETTMAAETINASDDEVISTLNLESSRVGAADFDAKRMHTLAVSTQNVAFDDQNDTSTEETEIYIINDTIYARFDNNWTKSELPDSEEIWEQENLVWYEAELLNRSELEIEGTDEVDGVPCDRYSVQPGLDAFLVVLSENLGTMLPLPYLDIPLLYNETEVEWTACVARDSNLLMSNDIQMDLDITPEIMGPLASIVGNATTRIDLQSSVEFTDLNEPVQIVLPDEALAAETLQIPPNQTGEVQGGIGETDEGSEGDEGNEGSEASEGDEGDGDE